MRHRIGLLFAAICLGGFRICGGKPPSQNAEVRLGLCLVGCHANFFLMAARFAVFLNTWESLKELPSVGHESLVIEFAVHSRGRSGIRLAEENVQLQSENPG